MAVFIIMIIMVLVQNLLEPFCCILGKDTLQYPSSPKF